MLKKSLIFALIAVVSAAFLVTGCSQGTDSGSTSIQIGGRLVDTEVKTEAELYDALHNPDFQIIAVIADTAALDLSTATVNKDVTEIPAGKTVVLYTSVTPPDQFEVKGTLVVEGNGILIANASHRVRVTDGNIEVINGTIQVASAVDIHGQDIQIQILGTGKAYFADGTLRITSPLATLDDVKTAFSWVPKGTLLLSPLTGTPTMVTQPVKPSEITQIPTTATRRLTIANALVTATPADTATNITVPAGMTFITNDPLTSLETLTVAGNLTLGATGATLNRVETLKVAAGGALTLSTTATALNNVTDFEVSGTITALTATYDQVTSLVVGSLFNAGTVNFNNLQTLKVNAGGAFVTTGTIGSDETDSEGIVLDIAAKGSAGAASIKKLRTSVVAGSLAIGGFTLFNTDSTLSAAAGGTINGITFPAETKPITGVGLNTVTSDDYTVPRNAILGLATGSILLFPAGKVLTFEPFATAEGDGVIKAVGSTTGGTIVIDGVEGYTTIDTGVEGDNFRTAVSALIADTGKLTDHIDLKPTFYSTGSAANYLGIGSVALTTTGATSITTLPDASAATPLLALTATTSWNPATPTFTYSIAGDAPTGVTTLPVSVSTVNLQVTDAAYNAPNARKVILTVTPAAGTKLKNNGLINAKDVPAFNIGVLTGRT
jgi:hypothetical protein